MVVSPKKLSNFLAHTSKKSISNRLRPKKLRKFSIFGIFLAKKFKVKVDALPHAFWSFLVEKFQSKSWCSTTSFDLWSWNLLWTLVCFIGTTIPKIFQIGWCRFFSPCRHPAMGANFQKYGKFGHFRDASKR